jgi:hypothetical protein
MRDGAKQAARAAVLIRANEIWVSRTVLLRNDCRSPLSAVPTASTGLYGRVAANPYCEGLLPDG